MKLALPATFLAAMVTCMLVFAPTPAAAQIGPGYPASDRCLALAELADFQVPLPPACFLRHAGYDCEPEQNPPEGWLRKDGYCDQANKVPIMSLTRPGDQGCAIKVRHGHAVCRKPHRPKPWLLD